MVSFMAVAFFCLAEKQCYFWSSKDLHISETKCLQELKAKSADIEAANITGYYQCVRVYLGKEA